MGTLDSDCENAISRLVDAGLLPLSGAEPADARARYRRIAAVLRDCQFVPNVASGEMVLDTPEISLAARWYRPPGSDYLPSVLYLHGGGHVLGDLDTHHAHASFVAIDANCVVLSVEYRLAPEHRWPTAAHDAMAATQWLLQNADVLGGDGRRFGIAGDSAGGNLAAVVLNRQAELTRPLAAALLAYPAVDYSLHRAYPSRLSQGNGYLSVADMAWFGSLYAGKGAPVDDPDLSPICGDLTGLPPMTLLVAERDPLCDEGLAYGRKVARSGGSVSLIEGHGLPHGFYDFATVSAHARRLILRGHKKFGGQLRTQW